MLARFVRWLTGVCGRVFARGGVVRSYEQIFAEHGEVEEVFVMRGGSRSGQACAFVRFTTAEGAVAAIQVSKRAIRAGMGLEGGSNGSWPLPAVAHRIA